MVVRRSGATTSTQLARGELTESGQYPGRYTARVPRFSDEVEEVAVLFEVTCPGGNVESARLDTYIDPSGTGSELGRASCRERGRPVVKISVGARNLKKKK